MKLSEKLKQHDARYDLRKAEIHRKNKLVKKVLEAITKSKNETANTRGKN